jgi:glutathione S-transferase
MNASTLTLHYYPSNASFTPHVLLRELGLPFALQKVDRSQQAHKSPAYLKLNPNGLIPVLVDGEQVLYETAAIVLHLVDKVPTAGLAPAVGTAERGEFYKWLIWLSATLQSQMPIYFYSDRYVAPGNAAGTAEVKAQAERRIEALIDQIEAHLAKTGGPWMMGERYSALDPYTLMLCRWTRGMQRPARTLPKVGAFLAAAVGLILLCVQRYRSDPLEPGQRLSSDVIGFHRGEPVAQRLLHGIEVAEHVVGESLLAQRLPQVLGRVELRAVGRQEHQPHVLGHDKLLGDVPAGLIHDHEHELVGMALGHLVQEHRHRLGADPRQHQAVHDAVVRADGAEGVEVLAFESCAHDRAHARRSPAPAR